MNTTDHENLAKWLATLKQIRAAMWELRTAEGCDYQDLSEADKAEALGAAITIREDTLENAHASLSEAIEYLEWVK